MAAGLSRETWEDVVGALEEFMPYYERVNRVSTFFRLPAWRAAAARSLHPEDRVLEIGPGSGGFAQTLAARCVYLLEPSPPILAYAMDRLEGDGYRPLLGVAEALPLQAGAVDKVFCIFSFRDFLDKRRALEEAYRVLAPGGQLHIVDLFRPPEGVRRALLELWLERGATTLLHLLVPRRTRARWRHDPYRELLRTYEAVGPASLYAGLMREVGFRPVEARDLLLGGVHHLKGDRPSTT